MSSTTLVILVCGRAASRPRRALVHSLPCLCRTAYVPTLNDTTKKKKRRIHYDDAETSVFFIPQYVYRSEKETNIEVSPPGCVYKFDWNSQTLLVKNPVDDTTDSLVFVRVSLNEQQRSVQRKRSKTPTRKKR